MLESVDRRKEPWDMLIIGGGASGLGAAVDSASRGYATLLLEGADFAAGTSSRSSKLIHGGVRYLQQGRLSFVFRSMLERELLLQNAPHLVHPLQFVVPTETVLSKYWIGMGLKIYDALAGQSAFQPSRLLSHSSLRTFIPELVADRFSGGVCYTDGQFDDARLAINLAQTIADLGGSVLNYMQVVGVIKSRGVVVGVDAIDVETGEHKEIFAKVVINATGVFTDEVRKFDDKEVEPSITFSRGSHIALDRDFFPCDNALLIPSTADGRVLFIIPWYNRILIGTTDVVAETPMAEPVATQEEIEYLLAHAARYLCRTPIVSDIRSAFAGIRALACPPKERWKSASISREHLVMVSPSTMVSSIGGKWTTYREIGEAIIDIAEKVGGFNARSCMTTTLPIHGYKQGGDISADRSFYGSDFLAINEMSGFGDSGTLNEKLHSDLSLRASDVIWAVQAEMARTVEDVLARRNRALFLDASASVEVAPKVAAIMKERLGKDELWVEREVLAFLRVAEGFK